MRRFLTKVCSFRIKSVLSFEKFVDKNSQLALIMVMKNNFKKLYHKVFAYHIGTTKRR